MNSNRIPGREHALRRWRRERAVRGAASVAWTLAGVLLFLNLLLWVLPVTMELLTVIGLLAAGALLAGLLVWLVPVFREPPEALLAKRADRVLGLPDDLLVWTEVEHSPEFQGRAGWTEALREEAMRKLDGTSWKEAWPVQVPRPTIAASVVCLLGLALLVGVGVGKFGQENLRLLALEAAKEERQEAAEEVLQDWEEFSALTDDEELRELFSSAQQLREALESQDPMEAMVEMNRIGEQMESLQAALEKESIAADAEAMAEALEAFDGMAALAAMLRRKNFEAAAGEARKLMEKAALAPNQEVPMRRQAAVSEMLAEQAASASGKGRNQLSKGLGQLSQAAARAATGEGSVRNSDLGEAMENLSDEFSNEAQRQNQGRMISMGRDQMEGLRRRMRGEEEGPMGMSLCQMAGMRPGQDGPGGDGTDPGGKEAGTGSSDPMADATEMVQPGTSETLTGIWGEGETEVRTLASAAGSGGVVSPGRAADFSEYAELSRRAVADEKLPLSHRRIIRSYFEEIRPVAENP